MVFHAEGSPFFIPSPSAWQLIVLGNHKTFSFSSLASSYLFPFSFFNHIRLLFNPLLAAPIPWVPLFGIKDQISMAGPVPKDALHDALTKEQERQKMSDRDSQEILLDEEGVALKDLSHQRSQGKETRPPFQSNVPSSTNVQKGWKRSTREEMMKDHHTTDTLALGRLYERMGKLSIIPRYVIYIVPLGVLIAIPIIVGALIPQLELGVCFFSLWEGVVVNW
jgi:hypothetical protein